MDEEGDCVDVCMVCGYRGVCVCIGVCMYRGVRVCIGVCVCVCVCVCIGVCVCMVRVYV